MNTSFVRFLSAFALFVLLTACAPPAEEQPLASLYPVPGARSLLPAAPANAAAAQHLSELLPGLAQNAGQTTTLEGALDAALRALIYIPGASGQQTAGKAPGAVLLVQTPQGSAIKAAGVADVEKRTPMSVYSRLEIGSTTQLFTAVLLAQLQEEGLLSLDDPLSQWLPDLAADIPNGDVVTLHHLAAHTSGIPDYAAAIIGAGVTDSEALRSAYTPEELVRYAIENGSPAFAPGEPGRWQFSNSNYILLGMVLEAAAGQSYASLLQQRIFDPLGMTQSALLQGEPQVSGLAQGYYAFPYDHNTTAWNGSQGWAAGGILSTAADMGKFGQALISGTLFQDPDTLEILADFTAVPDAAANAGALGMGNGLIEFAPGLWGYRGQNAGYTAIIAFDRAQQVLLVALANAAQSAAGEGDNLLGHYLHDGDR